MTLTEQLSLAFTADAKLAEQRATRIAVVGSRDWGNRRLLCALLDSEAQRYGRFTVISGECPLGGADRMAKDWAESRGHPFEPYEPPAHIKGPAKFHYRNRQIAKADLDKLIAFKWHRLWSDNRGTRSVVNYALAEGVPCYVVERSGDVWEAKGEVQ